MWNIFWGYDLNLPIVFLSWLKYSPGAYTPLQLFFVTIVELRTVWVLAIRHFVQPHTTFSTSSLIFSFSFSSYNFFLLLTDAISNNKENSDVRHSGDFQVSNFQELTLDELTKLTVKLSNHLDRIESAADAKAQKPVNDRSNPKAEKTVAKPSNNLRKIQPTNPITPPISLLDQPKLVLLGFLYISRAQFLREVSNSYVSCNLFGEDEIVNSKPIAFESCPAYNFSQVGLYSIINWKIEVKLKVICLCQNNRV